MPRSLSPSSMSTFTSCPLAFRFSYIERLPEPPSAPASKGTLVHLALQHLMWRPPAERTIENALADLDRAAAELAAHPEFAELELSDEEWAAFHADAEVLAPPLLRDGGPARDHRARRRAARHAPRPPTVSSIRGIIDRLELDADGELVDHRLQDRPRARRGLGTAEHGGHPHLLAAVRAHVRPPAQAHPAALPVEAGADRHPAERPVGARRRGEVGRGHEGGAHRVRPRRLPAPRVGVVLVLLVPGVLPGVRRRPRRRPRR